MFTLTSMPEELAALIRVMFEWTPSWRASSCCGGVHSTTFVEPLIYDDEKRLMHLKITSSNATILLHNVYLPYQSDDEADEYQDILGKIQAISDSFESANTFIFGESNEDIKKPSLFTPFLIAFINDCHLISSDTLLLPSDAFTYISDAHRSRSWLNHLLSTYSSHSSISNMEFKYDCVSSDNLPLCFTISAKLLPSSETNLCCIHPNCNDELSHSLLYKLYNDSLSDGVGASLVLLLFQMVSYGGILSPHLFNIYMDDLSVNLKLQIGCLHRHHSEP